MSDQTPDTTASAAPAEQGIAIPSPSTPATAGRVVLCFRPTGWSRNRDFREARPGIVANSFGGASTNCNVNVFLDGGNDADTLAEFRQSPSGNTLMSVPIYDPLTNEQRAELAKLGNAWCEWPLAPKPQPSPIPSVYERIEEQAAQISAIRDRLAESQGPKPEPAISEGQLDFVTRKTLENETRLAATTQALVDLAALLKNAGPPTKNAHEVVLASLNAAPSTEPAAS